MAKTCADCRERFSRDSGFETYAAEGGIIWICWRCYRKAQKVERSKSKPDDNTIPDTSFRRSFAAVLRKYGKAFKQLADHDEGKITIKVRDEWR